MELALAGLALVLAFAFIGVPLGYALLFVGIGGFALIRGLDPAMSMAAQQVLAIATNEPLSVLAQTESFNAVAGCEAPAVPWRDARGRADRPSHALW